MPKSEWSGIGEGQMNGSKLEPKLDPEQGTISFTLETVQEANQKINQIYGTADIQYHSIDSNAYQGGFNTYQLNQPTGQPTYSGQISNQLAGNYISYTVPAMGQASAGPYGLTASSSLTGLAGWLPEQSYPEPVVLHCSKPYPLEGLFEILVHIEEYGCGVCGNTAIQVLPTTVISLTAHQAEPYLLCCTEHGATSASLLLLSVQYPQYRSLYECLAPAGEN